MGLLWPGFLLLLGMVPILLGVYIWMLRRKRRFTVRYSSLLLIRAAMPQQSWWRRHLPAALFLLALVSLVLALARPVATVNVPSYQATIILTIDVSLSMRATDIHPSRLAAAQEAALDFIERQPATTQIGIVGFYGYAELLQAPTADRNDLRDAIRGLSTGRRTAIGSGILRSVDAIAEIDQNIIPITGESAPAEVTPMPPGEFAPNVIVLLTDGVANAGTPPLEAAQQAADRGIRVYTIGFGTANGFLPFGGAGNGRQGGNDPFDWGGNFRMGFDETTLKEIASMTGGEYYSASSAKELQDVFTSLPAYFTTRQETTEISFMFTGVGVILAALAIALALIWNPLP